MGTVAGGVALTKRTKEDPEQPGAAWSTGVLGGSQLGAHYFPE